MLPTNTMLDDVDYTFINLSDDFDLDEIGKDLTHDLMEK